MAKGKNDDALRNLARLHAQGNIEDPLVQGEFQAMKDVIDMEAEIDQSWRLVSDRVQLPRVVVETNSDPADLWRQDQLEKGLHGCCAPVLGSDDWCLCYSILRRVSLPCTAVWEYRLTNSDVFTAVGFADSALLINSINSVIGLIGQALCVMFLDRTGRRPPLILGNLLACLTFAVATYVLSSASSTCADDQRHGQAVCARRRRRKPRSGYLLCCHDLHLQLGLFGLYWSSLLGLVSLLHTICADDKAPWRSCRLESEPRRSV